MNIELSPKDRLLIVDDEKDNLEALRRLLRQHYEITTTASPFEALKLVQQEEFNVIISDQRMPEMSGVELLEKVKNVCPASTRILLTGYTDLDSVIGAVNRGHIYRYVAKPWDPEDLKITLRQANEAYHLRRELHKKNEALERSNTELQQAVEELRVLERAKARFLSLVSHELNTPLTVLNAFVPLVSEKKAAFPEDIRKAVGSISSATDRLSEIVSEVLAYVKLESEDKWAHQEFDLRAEVESLKVSLEKEFAKNAITLMISGEEKTKVKCDPEKMRLALRKLFHDAFLCSPKGKPVKGELRTKGKSVSLSVTREGEPLSPDAFKPLETQGNQLHHHRNLGLGLAICKFIVEGHRGEVLLPASDGKHTTITLMLHQR